MIWTSNSQRLITCKPEPLFAPRWSPDGKWILYSMAIGGNTDIYKISSAGGGTPVRLTDAPASTSAASFSPDGTKIVFESDRSGSQQVYVMNADGSNQKRISFFGGRAATPEWSPRGDQIAFTHIAGQFPHRGDEPGGGPALPDRQLAGRGADLGAQWPHHPVLPHRPQFRQDRDLAGRPDRAQRAQAANPGRRIGSRLGTGAAIRRLRPVRPIRLWPIGAPIVV
jgi:dipeptidyl aminopeptidase/acylaminoacyl peptidase